MTAGEWDIRWWVIYEDLRGQGEPEIAAGLLADRECVEQFGTRPDEETKR